MQNGEVAAKEHAHRYIFPEIRNHVTRTQPTTWSDLVHHAKIGEMCMPVASPTDPTLVVKMEAIQDQLKQLTTTNKVRSASPVCFAGRSDYRSRGDSSRTASPTRRVHFDRSADRGMQEYRNAEGSPREDRCSHSAGRQQWDAEPNRESKGGRRPRGSRGCRSSRRQEPQNTVHPKISAHRTTARCKTTAQFQTTDHRTLHSRCPLPSQPIPRHLPTWRLDGMLDKGQALRQSQCSVANVGVPHAHTQTCVRLRMTLVVVVAEKVTLCMFAIQQRDCKTCSSPSDDQRGIVELLGLDILLKLLTIPLLQL